MRFLARIHQKSTLKSEESGVYCQGNQRSWRIAVKRSAYLLSIACIALLFTDCGKYGSQTIAPAALAAFQPLPEQAPPGAIEDAMVTLGRMLYYEPRLSKAQDISCNTCHNLATYGAENEPTSTGFRGQKGNRNSPSVYNAAVHFAQFWDGRAPNVEEQAKGPVLNPVEMAMISDKQVMAVLKSMPEYTQAFKKAFPRGKDPVTYDNMGKAIGAFERGLITPARWDKFLRGDQTALSDPEKAGFNAFVKAGCPACHAGALLGGNMFQKIGAMKPWPDTSDTGRFKVTHNQADMLMFKVPSLRNVEKTGPYFHDGKVPTLSEAITKMGNYQLGRRLSANEIQSISIWMKCLTGVIPADYIKKPELPKSTARTPKPSEAE
jgi:cytochrome c peroxidase